MGTKGIWENKLKKANNYSSTQQSMQKEKSVIWVILPQNVINLISSSEKVFCDDLKKLLVG